MRNPLQDQLLKAGLAKKGKLAQVVRDQTKQRHAKGAQATDADKVDTARLQAERAEIFSLARRFQISDETSRRLVRELDLMEARYR